jgi:hypothetical protein
MSESASQDLIAVKIIMPLRGEGKSFNEIADTLNKKNIINSVGIPFNKQRVSDLYKAGELLEAINDGENSEIPEPSEVILNTELTEEEIKRLYECEIIIKTGMQTFIEVGKALTEIRDKKLFRKDFKTFDEYCKTKWKFDKTYASRLINSQPVIQNLLTMGNTLPESERQTRELLKLSPDEQKEVWQKVIEVSELLSKPITAALVKEQVESFKNPEPVIREVIKEIEVIKDPNPELQRELDNVIKINSELGDNLERKDTQVLKLGNENHELLKSRNALQNQIKDYQEKIDQMDQKLKSIQSSTDGNVDHLKTQQLKLQKELDEKKTKLSELEKFKEDHEHTEGLLINKLEFDKKGSEFFSDSENLKKVTEILYKSRDFFQKEVLYLAALELRPATIKVMQKEVTELLEIVGNWQFMIQSKFLIDNNYEKSLMKIER